jgi:hypothetical protein
MKKELVLSVLSNDESSSDEELKNYFSACGLPANVIDRAIKARPLFLAGLYYDGEKALNFRQ